MAKEKPYEVHCHDFTLYGYKDKIVAVFFTEDDAWDYIDNLAEQHSNIVYDLYTVDTIAD